MRILTLNESLEEKVAKLKELSGLPILVGSGRSEPLDRFLATKTLDEVVLCIPWKREGRICTSEGKLDGQAERERTRHRERVNTEMLRAVGLYPRAGKHITVSVEGQVVPEELSSFVFDTRMPTYKALQFYISEYIANPLRAVPKDRFFLIQKVHEQRFKETVFYTYKQIASPGQHLPTWSHVGEAWNRYTIVDKPPGDCIVCAGASGERIHFGHIAWGPGPYCAGLICRACARQSFEQILQLLADAGQKDVG